MNEKHFKSLIEHAMDVITVLDADGVIRFESPSVERIIGYKPEELVGKPALDFVHPDDVPDVAGTLAEAFQNPGVVHSAEFRFRHKDGSWRLLDGVGKSIVDDVGDTSVVVNARDVTERKQMEQHITEALDLNQKIIAASTLGIAAYEASGKCVMANASAVEIVGATKEQVLQQNFYHIESWKKSGLLETAKKALTSGAEQRREIHVVSTFGKEVWLDCRLVPFASNGQPHLLLLINDVTDRRQAEEALRKAHDEMEVRVRERTAELAASERFLQNVFDGIQDGISVLDRDLNVLRTNAWIEHMYAGELPLTGKKCYAVYQHRDSPCPWCPSVPAMETGTPQTETVPHPSPDNPTGWMELSAFPLENADGQIIGTIEHVKDVTERVRAEEALQESEERYRTLFNHVPAGLYRTTPDGQFLDANQALARILGFPDRETLLQTPTPVLYVDPEDRKRWQVIMERDGVVEDFEIAVHHRNGEIGWVRHSGRAVRDADGNVLHYEGAVMDVTERKRAQEKLERYAEELARSNAELEQFAYVASHDLQEPLRMVSSYLTLLQRRYAGQLDTDADEFIDYAVDGASRMQQLISDLLIYSRVNTRGKEFTPTHCERVLDNVLRNLQMLIEETGATITHDPLPAVMGDEVQLGQLFQNLIGNAIKFRGEAPPEIHVGIEQAGGEWRFAVRDNGIGIDPKDHKRIFVIFQRLHSRREHPGTGIGLAVSKRIVERHGGRIWVGSEPGAGSTFFFTIPILGEH